MLPDEAKRALRARMKAARDALPAEARALASARVVERLLGWEVWARARGIAFYHPLPAEIDLRPAWERAWTEGRRVYLPRVDGPRGLAFCPVTPGTVLVRSRFGVQEPPGDTPRAGVGDIDLFLVPGLAFDGAGGRLGFGAGWYDRGLAELGRGATRVGVGFDLQYVPPMLQEPWDVPMHWILTDSRLVRAGEGP